MGLGFVPPPCPGLGGRGPSLFEEPHEDSATTREIANKNKLLFILLSNCCLCICRLETIEELSHCSKNGAGGVKQVNAMACYSG